MAPARAIEALGRLFQRHPVPTNEELASYAAAVRPAVVRAERLYEQWFETAALLDDNAKLANSAAIHRWELATMGQALERVTPPAALARPHAEVVAALVMGSRAAQLLSNGSRFHSASAVCDGQTLLESSRKRRLAAAARIRRALERNQVPWDSDDPTPGPSGPLASPQESLPRS